VLLRGGARAASDTRRTREDGDRPARPPGWGAPLEVAGITPATSGWTLLESTGTRLARQGIPLACSSLPRHIHTRGRAVEDLQGDDRG